MLIKQCQFSGKDDDGVYFHLLRPGYRNSGLAKTASAKQAVLDEVAHVMSKVPRNSNLLYALVSAMGAWEYWGQNTNGDAFPERALIHTPKGWGDLPFDLRPRVGKNWEWGYPTFYNANAFQHHVNKDPARAFGEVVHAMWDPFMKRVLLIIAFDRGRAEMMGAISVIDKIENGEFPDVSMGCKVPYDVCTRCGDWDRITGNPKVDLDNHRKNPIQGLSETTKDYCDHLTNELGRIYSDGVKAGMLNLHPRFFDISVVFIGADKTSKVMAKLAGRCPIREKAAVCGNCRDCDISSTHVYEVWTGGREKVASDQDALIKEAFAPGDDIGTTEAEERSLNRYFKRWKNKQAEIEKEVRSTFSPMLSRMDEREEDLPDDVLDEMASDIPKGLSTAGSMGIVLKPREFQRTVLTSLGHKPLAEEMDSRGVCFRPGAPPEEGFDSRSTGFMPRLIEKLIPLLASRSAFGPAFHKRIIIMVSGKPEHGCELQRQNEELDHPLLHKLSSAYSDYRRHLIYKVAEDARAMVEQHPYILNELFPEALEFSFSTGLAKTGGDVMQSLIGMMPTMYLNGAYLDEPVSSYISTHPDYEGIVTAGTLVTHGRVA